MMTPATNKRTTLLIVAVAAFAAFASCAPDPDPPLGIDGPTTNGDPDMGAPDTATDPDMSRPTDMARPGDTGRETDMGADASETGCDTMDCGSGTCIEAGGESICACDAGFAGEACGECETGYMGDLCDECADGFAVDPLGGTVCLPDPCAPDPCNGNGACFPTNDPTGGDPTDCRCDPGFAGDACDTCDTGYTGTNCDACAAGYTLESGVCVILACSPAPCDHGLCLDADGNGTAECVCETGWTGRDCGTCAAGFVLDPTNGQCVPDVCLNVPCDHGTCGPNPTGGAAFCQCDTGYEGAACDTCAFGYTEIRVGFCVNDLPVRDARVTGWFDAAKANTVDLVNGDGVHSWRNRMQPYGMSEPGSAPSLRPRYILLPQPAIEFDGNDTLWAAHDLVGITDAYSIFVVVTWGAATTGDYIVDSLYSVDTAEAYSIKVWDEFAEFAHGDGPNGPETVKLGGYDPTSGPQLVVAQRQPFLNGRVMSVSDGTQATTAQSALPDINEQTLSLLGAQSNGGAWGTNGLDGRLHEVIYVKGALTADERDAISAYLTVKWGL